MKFGDVRRDTDDGITVMYIGTLTRDFVVDEVSRRCKSGDQVMVTLDRGSWTPATPSENYWPVGKVGWINGEWGEEVTE